MNYVFPLVTLSVTYTRVGIELWGSRAIGEDISMQHDRVKSKRKVGNRRKYDNITKQINLQYYTHTNNIYHMEALLSNLNTGRNT